MAIFGRVRSKLNFCLFVPQPRATMPRVFVFRAIVLFLVFVLTFAFWLFYGVRIFKEKQGTYEVRLKLFIFTN